MSESKKTRFKGIPSWQRQDNTEPSDVSDQPDPQDSSSQLPPDPRGALIAKAAVFLEDDDIKNAPTERKQYFLQSKGLTETEIDALLKSQNAADAEAVEELQEEEEQQEGSGIEDVRSKGSSRPSEIVPSSQETPDTSSKANPPIITYPEFLVHSQKPPPLITARRLLTSLYVVSGTAATVYGTGKYIVNPMIESLNSARHSFFDTASTNLETLNEKLEAAVSNIPEQNLASGDQVDMDMESVDSDPAHFFSRSTATQTSPGLSRATSPVSSEHLAPTSMATAHDTTLSTIRNLLSDLRPTDNAKPSPVKKSVDDLRTYLDGLAYGNAIHPLWKPVDRGKMDEVAKVKAEIRNVKGVLLSARNFPSGVAVK